MRPTHSQGILEKLAHAIVTGAIVPGEKLEEQALANEFAVSRTPVREALRQLNGMGLVEMRPRGGVAVARIEVAQLADMFEALGELEGVCAKFSANRMREVERQKLRILVEKGAGAVAANEVAEYARLNEQVHDLIYQGAHNASILQTTQSFRKRLAPFRVPTFRMMGERMHSSLREHREILAAIANLPITSWNYKSQNPSIRHIGPMAQDFYVAFGLGESDESITTVDISGINLLAVQALERRTADLAAENAQQQRAIESLKKIVEKLRAELRLSRVPREPEKLRSPR